MTTVTAATTAPRRPDPCVYLFKAGTSYKIGVTSDVGKRRGQVQSQCPDPVEIVLTITEGDAKQIERQLHETFHHRWLHGEWFELTPQDVSRIKAGQYTPSPPAPPASPSPAPARKPPTPANPPAPPPPPARRAADTIARTLNLVGWVAVALLLGAGLFVGTAYYEQAKQWAPATVDAAPARFRSDPPAAPPPSVPPPPAARPVQAPPPVGQPVVVPPPAAPPAPAPAAPVDAAPAPAAPAPPAPTAAPAPPAMEGGGLAAGAGRWVTRMGATPTVEP